MKRLTLALFLLCAFCFTAQAQQTSVNAADYSTNLAPGALASAFGVDLAIATEQAKSTPLPTELAGTRVLVNGKAAPLLFVSPAQINYQIPEGTPAGNIEVIVERANARARETINVRNAAFASFSFDASGSGAGAILDGRPFRQGPHEIRHPPFARAVLTGRKHELAGGQHFPAGERHQEATAAVVELARVHALALGSPALNTQARIAAALVASAHTS